MSTARARCVCCAPEFMCAGQTHTKSCFAQKVLGPGSERDLALSQQRLAALFESQAKLANLDLPQPAKKAVAVASGALAQKLREVIRSSEVEINGAFKALGLQPVELLQALPAPGERLLDLASFAATLNPCLVSVAEKTLLAPVGKCEATGRQAAGSPVSHLHAAASLSISAAAAGVNCQFSARCARCNAAGRITLTVSKCCRAKMRLQSMRSSLWRPRSQLRLWRQGATTH